MIQELNRILQAIIHGQLQSIYTVGYDGHDTKRSSQTY